MFFPDLKIGKFQVEDPKESAGTCSQRCPFPGIPANAYGQLIPGRGGDVSARNISWDDRTTLFNEGVAVAFHCLYNEMMESDAPTIACQKDGTWSNIDRVANLRCDGNCLFINQWLHNCVLIRAHGA